MSDGAIDRIEEAAGTAPRARPRPARPLISIIAPCYNEADALGPFMMEIAPVLDGANFDYELVFVDDGSTDDTRAKLEKLAGENSHVKVVIFSRNFGKEAALTAGLDHAKGDAVVVIDTDLQDPPELIRDFVAKWREGVDVVYGKREDRGADTAAKRMTAEGFYRLFNRISVVNIPENTGDFRLMDRRVVEVIKTLPERSRFMKGLFVWAGFSSVAVPYARPARAAGETKFNFWKLWNFALDGFVSFSTAPLRVWSYIGAVVAFLSFLYASFIIIRTVFTGVDVPGYASLVVLILFFGSVQMISVGVLGEYISRLFVEVKRRPIYIVDEVLGDDGASNQND
ncbi:glycosyltransferase family 2 protein [Hyphococcus luteus]|uniref:Glycosyltransferase n=1 Tax=Hyphococcus luteus TaxID=2058213 RepID=A0A2S7K7Y3_9PROT|nr:glycosyltransferase family 2 protein [Marinicaulis flavus]PQA88610.1 glycosyltransferase [Marinicaulis flavus]